MTCIVGLKAKNEFILACDSQVTIGNAKAYLNHFSDAKISINEDKKGAIAVCGNAKITMCKYTENLFDDFDKEFRYFNYDYVVNKFIYKLYDELKKLNICPEEKVDMQFPGAMIVMSQNKGFFIDDNRLVIEINDWCASGSGENIADTIFTLTKDEPNPLKRIVLAMKANEKHTLYVSGDIFYVSSKDYELKKIDDQFIEDTLKEYYK